MKEKLEKYIKERKQTLAELVRKFDYEIDKHRLDEVEQLEKFIRDLITEEIGEEKGSKKYIQEPQGWTIPNYTQPLTEGDDEKLKKWGLARNENPEAIYKAKVTEGEGVKATDKIIEHLKVGDIKKAREVFDNFTEKPQQESNKEEILKNEIDKKTRASVELYLGGEEPSKKEECIGCERGVKHVCIPEPSKKPSERIDEFFDLTEKDRNWNGRWIVAIMDYLDELHNQGKI